MASNQASFRWTLIVLHLLVLCLTMMVNGRQRLCDEEQTFCTVGLCTVQGCDVCAHRMANCKTDNASEPIPQNLPKNTIYLNINYQGTAIGLTSKMFENYMGLSKVKFVGRFSYMAPDTFQQHKFLHSLHLEHTLISSLPNRLFCDSSVLEELLLPNNKITSVPENVFYQIKRLNSLDISYNPINPCGMDSIGERFRDLPNLKVVSLKGLGKKRELNCSLHPDLLSPLSHIELLDLSESLIFQGNEVIAQSLTGLSMLIINNMDVYKSCPALANNLFKYIPPHLNSLRAQSWKTSLPMTENCTLNSESFAYLTKRGSKLSSIDFSYSDKILGDGISTDLFEGLSLLSLDLSWCRIVAIETGALNSHPHISSLRLVGNQLGPRNFKLFTKLRSGYHLKQLSLANIEMFSNAHFPYNLGSILKASPNITELHLNDNNIEVLPKFVEHHDERKPVAYHISELNLNDNRLTDLSKNATLELCSVMLHLLYFSASSNRIVDVTGVCKTLVFLVLGDNYIGENAAQNFETIKYLVNLTKLDIPRNGIRSVPADLVSRMPGLKAFIMAGNELNVIPPNIFSKNPHLTLLDLSENMLTSVDYSTFQYSDIFSRIYLQGNLLSQITEKLIGRLDFILSNKSTPAHPARKTVRMLDISGNPLDCTCKTRYLQQWIQTSTVIADVKNLTCGNYDANRQNDLVFNYEYSDFHCLWRTRIIFAGSVLAALVIFVPLGICMYKHCWYIKHLRVVCIAMASSMQKAKMNVNCNYDAFISYNTKNNRDMRLVQEMLIPQLEGIPETESNHCGPEDIIEGKTTLYIHDRDAEIGSERFTNLCKAVENSRKLIILLSNSYLASDACLNEANLLAGYETDGADCYHPDRILILVLEEPNEQMIRPPITGLLTGNVLDMTENVRKSQRKMNSVWSRVQKFISKPKYSYKKKSKRKQLRTTVHTRVRDRERYAYQSISQA